MCVCFPFGNYTILHSGQDVNTFCKKTKIIFQDWFLILYQILISGYTLVYEDIDASLISGYLRLIPKTSYHDIIIIIFQY